MFHRNFQCSHPLTIPGSSRPGRTNCWPFSSFTPYCFVLTQNDFQTKYDVSILPNYTSNTANISGQSNLCNLTQKWLSWVLGSHRSSFCLVLRLLSQSFRGLSISCEPCSDESFRNSPPAWMKLTQENVPEPFHGLCSLLTPGGYQVWGRPFYFQVCLINLKHDKYIWVREFDPFFTLIPLRLCHRFQITHLQPVCN